MLKNSDILWTAWESDRLVGLARALTDFSYACYVSDLAVDKNCQKQGIGKKLLECLQNQLGEEVALVLLAAPNAMDYYPKVGFESAPNAFLIPRKSF